MRGCLQKAKHAIVKLYVFRKWSVCFFSGNKFWGHMLSLSYLWRRLPTAISERVCPSSWNAANIPSMCIYPVWFLNGRMNCIEKVLTDTTWGFGYTRQSPEDVFWISSIPQRAVEDLFLENSAWLGKPRRRAEEGGFPWPICSLLPWRWRAGLMERFLC